MGAAVLATILLLHHSGAQIKQQDIQRATVPPRLDGTHPCVFASLSGGSTAPALGTCATPTAHAGSTDRVEVDLRYGAFVLRQTDLLLNDVFDAPLTRSYTSVDWAVQPVPHAFGFNTNHPYDIGPVGTRTPYTYLILVLEDGDVLYFPRISEGTGFANAVYMHTETSTRFYKATIAWNGDGWTLRLADGSEIRFPEAYNAKNLAQGAANEIRDGAGNKLLLQRDDQRNLQEIRTPHGHWIHLHYDDQARIVQAENDSGNSVRYGYYSDGTLEYAIDSSGRQRYYQYDGHLMTAVLDEHSQFLVRNWYIGGILARQQFAKGDIYAYDFGSSPGKSYFDSVIITLPDHTQKQVQLTDSVPNILRLH